MAILLGILMAAVLAAAAAANGAGASFVSFCAAGRLSPRRAAQWGTIFHVLGGAIVVILVATKPIPDFSAWPAVVPGEFAAQGITLAAVGLAASIVLIAAHLLGLAVPLLFPITGALIGTGIVGSLHGIYMTPLLNQLVYPAVAGFGVALFLTYLACAGGARWLGGQTTQRAFYVKRGHRVLATIPHTENPMAALIALRMAGWEDLTLERRYYTEQTAGSVPNRAFAALETPWVHLAHATSAGLSALFRGALITGLIAVAWQDLQLQIYALIAAVIGMLAGGLRSSVVTRALAKQLSTQELRAPILANLAGFIAWTIVLPVVLFFDNLITICGSLLGASLSRHRADWESALYQVVAWFVAIPVTAALAALCFLGLRGIA